MASYSSDEQIIQDHIQQVATILRTLNLINSMDSIKSVGKILIKKMNYNDEQGHTIPIDPIKFLPKQSEQIEKKNQTIKKRILASYEPDDLSKAVNLIIAINNLLVSSGLGNRYGLYIKPHNIKTKNKTTLIPDEILNKLQDLMQTAEPHDESDNIQIETPEDIIELQNAEQAPKRARVEKENEIPQQTIMQPLGALGEYETPAPEYVLPHLDMPPEYEEEYENLFPNIQ